MATYIMFSRDNPQPLSSFTSIRSSLSSIYRNYDFHLNLVKMTGIVVFHSIISATLILTNSVYEMEKVYNRSDCIQLTSPIQTFQSDEQWNKTVCDYMRISTSRRILCYCVCLPEGSENWFLGPHSRKTYNTQNRAISELTSMELPKETSKPH